ncbi:MAG: hypothetical protein M3O31_10510 [Acidobacteriota bacterium]|nr:hypothetical protein [Acidobacteriota bacterium]
MRSTTLGTACIAFAIALSGCNNSVMVSPIYLGVNISPRPGSIPAGASVVFTGTVSNNLSLPHWSVLDAAQANNPGTLTPVTSSTTSILYTAPPTPPVYTQTATGITQGTVTLDATVTDPAGTSSPVSSDSVSFVITAPAVTLGLTPLTANVALGNTQQFFGYAVGNLNNTLIWQVSGIPGGSTTVGTINVGGTYVAPSNMPVTGPVVTITILSLADPTKTLSAVVNLQ